MPHNVSQDQFLTALRQPSAAVPLGLSGQTGNPAGKRFNVYRNNVAVSLKEALFAAFPLLARILGTKNFDGLARLYVAQHPPASPLMMHYGAQMPDFIAAQEELNRFPYLPDVARLEIALRRSYHAADHGAFDPNALAQMDEEQLGRAVFHLAPSALALPSNFPLYDIWAYNVDQRSDPPRPAPQSVLILRPEFDPMVFEISAAEVTLFDALKCGAPLGMAAQNTDPARLLSLLLSHHAICAVTPKEI